MNHHNRWRIGALASAIALLGSLASLQAHALALGRITVQSALGEPLRAEIDLADINPEESSNLRVGVASAETFKAAGLEYSAAVTGLDIRLQRRADGRPYLRLSSSRAVNEPFVDLIVETNGVSGRMTRDYTMLFDPPRLRSGAGPVETSPAVASRAPAQTIASAAPASTVRDATPVSGSPSLPPVNRPAPQARAPVVKAVATRTDSVATRTDSVGGRQVIVRPGDTASAIAARNKPASVSLDQMLAAMLRNNPAAFVDGNINIVKSGAVLNIPGEETAGTSPGEARTLVAQSKDFNAFRRKLADGAPAAQVGGAGRQADGKLQATVEDRAAKPSAPDKLTLSGGAVGAKSAPENSPATLSGTSPAANASSAPKGVAATEGSPLAAAAASAADASAGIAAASALAAASAAGAGAAAPIASASEPAPAASAAAAPASGPVIKPVATATPEPAPTSLIDDALGHPLMPWGAGGLLLLLLGGLLFARYRHHKNKDHVDSSFLESRVQLDSFFGASGGQRIDTRASHINTSTSAAYTPSQLDHAGDVDPVAEADVYLAYGRDQQAEEILKEALRSHPTRVAVHAKLVEIYAKRRDTKAFDSTALEAFRLTQGNGGEWAHITKLGRELNPSNPMYRSRAETANAAQNDSLVAKSLARTEHAPLDAPPLKSIGSQAAIVDFRPEGETQPQFSSSALGTPSAFLEELDLDLDLDIESAPAPLMADLPRAQVSVLPPARPPSREPEVFSNGLDFKPETFITPQASQPEAGPQAAHSGMLEFDLNSLSLDLGPETRAPSSDTDNGSDDPLEVKFLLAEEFRVLGDSAGARSLADEVLTKAKGPLKVKAQAFLNTLA